ncbi:hypothetical protein Tco_0308899 [Tanacetum coccineum]
MPNKAAENMSSEDVNAVTGRYLSTDFVVSNAKGNKDEYRIFKDHAFMLEFDWATTIRKAYVKDCAFVRYPFQRQNIDNIEPIDKKYLIDVVGYMTNVGMTTQQRTRSTTLDFYLANERLTLLCDALIEKKTKHLYLSSISSIQILDDPKILALKEFKEKISDNSVELHGVAMHVDHSKHKDGRMENLLIWARNRKNDSSTFQCRVRINNFITIKGWNYPSCRGEKCKKVITQKDGSFWLELDVSDKTAVAIVVMFDETATNLVKCSIESITEVGDEYPDGHPGVPRAITNVIGTTHILELMSHTYYEHVMFESFMCWKIIPEESVEESAGLSTVDTRADVQTPRLKRLARHPSVSTPSKPTEDEKNKRVDLEDSDAEMSCPSSDAQEDANGICPSEKRKKKRLVHNTY